MVVFYGIAVFICELQPVTIQSKPSQENQPVETSFLDKVEINKSDLSDEELKRGFNAWKCIAVFLRILVQHTIINTHYQTVVFLLN
jgi:hypothetical protein